MTHAAPAIAPSTDACWNRIGVRGDASCEQLAAHVHCRNCPVFTAAGASLLDAATPPGYREYWTARVADDKALADTGLQSMLVFRLRNEWLALPTVVLDEVAGMRAIHSLPHRRGGVLLGLANVRGELRACVSLARLLGLHDGAPDTPAAAQQRLLVARHGEHRVALPVDEVHGTQRYHPRQLQERPATIALSSAPYTKAVLPWRQSAIGLLDEQVLFNAIDRSLASASAT